MLHRLSDLVRLRTFAPTLIQPVGAADKDVLSDLPLGMRVPAKVAAALSDGTFRVEVQGQSLILRLPYRAHAGDLLQLTVAAREPRLRFAVAPQDDPAAPPARLSETARFITALLSESEKLPVTGVARGEHPLLPGAPADTAEMAAALRTAISGSGLFYEAHQAEWAAGLRPLAELQQEPQAQMQALPTVPAVAEDDLPVTPADTSDPAPRMPELPVHRDALGIVRHQLETLDTRQVIWHGLIWQGQPIDWEVAEYPHTARALPEEQEWRTRVRLTLPRLGAVDASMLITPHGVMIALQADAAATNATLHENRPGLKRALQDAGIAPLDITVMRDAAR